VISWPLYNVLLPVLPYSPLYFPAILFLRILSWRTSLAARALGRLLLAGGALEEYNCRQRKESFRHPSPPSMGPGSCTSVQGIDCRICRWTSTIGTELSECRLQIKNGKVNCWFKRWTMINDKDIAPTLLSALKKYSSHEGQLSLSVFVILLNPWRQMLDCVLKYAPACLLYHSQLCPILLMYF
jgi:hypothetical protein